MAKYTHTNINARNWKALSSFYQQVFGCVPEGPERDLYGNWFERVTGIPGVHVRGQHLAVPGYPPGGPTLEIFTYSIPEGESALPINGYGFAHIGFEVPDVAETFERFKAAGGRAYGEMVVEYYPSLDKTLTIQYSKDPEGNVVEILHWQEGQCV